MKKTVYMLGALAAVGGLSAGAGGILTKVDEVGVEVVEVVEEKEPAVILKYDLAPIATPVIRGRKVARYVQIAARYELEGEETLEQARELLPLLRDDLVRSLHMDPVPLIGEDAELDMEALHERFLSTGKKFLGSVHKVTVGNARASTFIVRSSEPAPKKKKKSGGGGH